MGVVVAVTVGVKGGVADAAAVGVGVDVTIGAVVVSGMEVCAVAGAGVILDAPDVVGVHGGDGGNSPANRAEPPILTIHWAL